MTSLKAEWGKQTHQPTMTQNFNHTGTPDVNCNSVGKESACSAGPRFDSWVGKAPGEGNGNPLQYSCLENPMDRGAWRATVHGVARVRHDLATKPPPISRSQA